ncbi:MAG: hypothetical protein ACYC5O_08995 [Anaerolineae bacterium]
MTEFGLPRVSFAGKAVSRMLIGGNPFAGFGHRPSDPDFDRQLRAYFTDEKVLETLTTAVRAGINAFHGRGDASTFRHLANYRAWSTAQPDHPTLHWLGQTAPDGYVDGRPEPNIEKMAGYGPIAIYLHGATTDRLFSEGKVAELGRLVAFIKSLGLPAGIGAHSPAPLRAAQALGVGADFYILSLRSVNDEPQVCADEADNRGAFRELPTQMVAIKVLAAGRIPPAEAFAYAAGCLKPHDLMTVGMRDYEVAENVGAATAAFAAAV